MRVHAEEVVFEGADSSASAADPGIVFAAVDMMVFSDGKSTLFILQR